MSNLWQTTSSRRTGPFDQAGQETSAAESSCWHQQAHETRRQPERSFRAAIELKRRDARDVEIPTSRFYSLRIDLDGCRRCVSVTCRVQACFCLNDVLTRQDVLSIKTEVLEAKGIVIVSGMAPNTFSGRSQSRRCTRGRLGQGASRREYYQRLERSYHVAGLAIERFCGGRLLC